MHLSTSGLKGHDLALDLGNRTLVQGANASGKTSIADAVAIVALGWVPRLGRTPAATAALMRGRELQVRMVLDDGRWIERTLRLKAKGGYETETRVSWSDAARSEEHEAEALAVFGRSADEVGQACDISQLLTLTGNQRAAALQELLEQGNDPAALTRAVARRWVQRLAGVDDARMEDIDDHTSLRPLIPGHDAGGEHTGQYALLAATAPLLRATVSEVGISGAASWANTEKRAAATGLREKTAARAELSARLREIPAPDESEMARLEEERAALDRQIGAATERDAARGRQAGLMAQAREALRVATARHDAATAARAAFDADTAELPGWRAQLDSVLVALDGLSTPPPPDFTEAEALEREAGDMNRAAEAVKLPTMPDLPGLRSAIEQAEAAHRIAESSPWARVDTIADEVAALVIRYGKGRPNLVDTVGERMAELGILAASNGPGDLTERLATLTAAREAHAAAEAAWPDLTARHETADAEVARLREAATQARADAEALRVTLTEAYRQGRARYTTRQAALAIDRDRLRVLVDGHSGRDQMTRESVATAVAALRAARARLTDLGDATGAPDAADVSIADLQSGRDRTRQQLGVLTRAQAAHAECRRLVDEIDRLKTSEVVFKALEDSLQWVRAEELAHGGGPLILIMCRVLAGAGRPERPYIRAEKGVCELGWRDTGGNEVAVQALSGAEYVLFSAALAAAVITLRGAAVRVLVVESAEAVDHPHGPQSLSELLAGLAAADSLTCVVLTPNEPSVPAAGWDVIRLVAREQAAVAA